MFTRDAWTGRLLGAGGRLSYALRGPQDNPEMESFFGRFKVENRSLILDANPSRNSGPSFGSESDTTIGWVVTPPSETGRPWQSSKASTTRAEQHNQPRGQVSNFWGSLQITVLQQKGDAPMSRSARFLVPLFLLACTSDLVFPPEPEEVDPPSDPASDTTVTPTPTAVDPARPTAIAIETVVDVEGYFGPRCRSEFACGSDDYRHRSTFRPAGDTVRLESYVDIGARVYDQHGKRMRDLDVEWHLTEPLSYITEFGGDLTVEPYTDYGWGGNITFRGCGCHIVRLNNGNSYPLEPVWTFIVASLQVSDSLTLADTVAVVVPMRLERFPDLLEYAHHLEIGASASMDLTGLFASSRGLPITHDASVSKVWGAPPGPEAAEVEAVNNTVTVRGIADGVMDLGITARTMEETGSLSARVYVGDIPCPAMGLERASDQRFRIEISHDADLAPCVRSTIEGAAGWWEKALAGTALAESTPCGIAANTLAVTIETEFQEFGGPIGTAHASCSDSLARAGTLVLSEQVFLGIDGDPRFHTPRINLMYQAARHEIGHVLGLVGYSGPSRALVEGDAFIGAHAVTEYKRLGGTGDMVPLEANDAAHWSKDALRVELMTRSMGIAQEPPVSAITLGALADIGWAVDMSVAEDYQVEQRHQSAGERERRIVFHEPR